MKQSDLKKLVPIVDMVFQTEQAKMADINKRIAALKQALDGLTATRSQTKHQLDPATKAGADLRWMAWAEARRKAINLELAKAMGEREAMREALQRAFGRVQAVEALIKMQAPKKG